jgi:hypothetical protein
MLLDGFGWVQITPKDFNLLKVHIDTETLNHDLDLLTSS